MSDDHLALSCHQPLTLWRAACEEAECVIIRGRKHLLFTEEMLVRVGSAIEDAAGVKEVDRG